MRRVLLIIFLSAFVSATSGNAQEQTAAIEGVISDTAGASIPSALVAVVSSAVHLENRTDRNGTYRFPSLPPNSYLIRVHASGFADVAVPVELQLGSSRIVNLRLTPAAVNETVTVIANETGTIDTTSSAVTSRITAAEFERLPHGRDYTTLVTYAAGATDEPKLRGISINGSSGAENRFSLDGADISDPLTGVSGKIVIPDVVDELQVKLAGYAAEYGGATGGVINVITRTGSNTVRTSAWLHYSREGWAGAPRPALLVNAIGLAYFEGTPHKDQESTTEPGISLSGPVIRDHLWFFGLVQPTLTHTTRVVAFSDGSVAPFTRRFDRSNDTLNLTGTVGTRIVSKFAANLSGYQATGELPPSSGFTASDPLAYALHEQNTNASFSGYVDFLATQAALIDVRIGEFRTEDRVSGIPSLPRIYFDTSNATIGGIPPALVRNEGFYNFPTNDAIDHDNFDRQTAGLDFQYTASFLGRHTIKTGVQIEHLRNDVLSGMVGPSYEFFWNDSNPLIGDQGRGTYGSFVAEVERDAGHATSSNRAIFLQDSWSLPKDRLTLNLGVRAESENVPSYADRSLGLSSDVINFRFGDKIAPRFGFAYDVLGDQSWKLYGSRGIFYDRVKLALPLRSFGGYRDVYYNFRLNTYDWPDITCSGLNGLPTDHPSCTGLEFVSLLDAVPAAPNGVYQVDPSLKPIASREWSIGVEHDLRRVHFALRGIHKSTDRAIENVGIWDGSAYRLIIANPGEGMAAQVKPSIPNLPRPVRRYDAIQLEAQGSLTRRIWTRVSYVFSRLWGNYSGLYNSDELQDNPIYGTTFANVPYGLFGSDGKPVYGRLATDRPHELKWQAFVELPRRVTIGANQYAASGTPLSRQMRYGGAFFFPEGRGSMGRTPWMTQTDLFLSAQLPLPHHLTSALEVNVLNVFDQKAVTSVYQVYSAQNLPLSDQAFFAGFNADAVAAKVRKDPRFGSPVAFQAPREITMTAKFVF